MNLGSTKQLYSRIESYECTIQCEVKNILCAFFLFFLCSLCSLLCAFGFVCFCFVSSRKAQKCMNEAEKKQRRHAVNVGSDPRPPCEANRCTLHCSPVRHRWRTMEVQEYSATKYKPDLLYPSLYSSVETPELLYTNTEKKLLLSFISVLVEMETLSQLHQLAEIQIFRGVMTCGWISAGSRAGEHEQILWFPLTGRRSGPKEEAFSVWAVAVRSASASEWHHARFHTQNLFWFFFQQGWNVFLVIFWILCWWSVSFQWLFIGGY